MLPAPVKLEPLPPPPPPLTDAEIAVLPPHLIEMGLKLGEFTAEQIERARAAEQ